jgi:hypothetical protein
LHPYSLLCVTSTPEPQPAAPARPDAVATGGAYAALFVLGAAEGLLGCFQYSHTVGSVPVAALVFCFLIFVTCLLGGQGMSSPLGAVVPALGWFLASLVLTMPSAGGSVIVANTSAGKWYLYGGAVSAALAVVLTFLSRAGRPRRPDRSSRVSQAGPPGGWPGRVDLWPR